MRLFNTIAIFDVYTVAETGEEARAALLAWLPEGTPSEVVAVEASREQSIRSAWREEKPLVANDVSDADFKKLEGKTTLAIFQHIYQKR